MKAKAYYCAALAAICGAIGTVSAIEWEQVGLAAGAALLLGMMAAADIFVNLANRAGKRRRIMFRAETAEQFRIMKWMERNFRDESVQKVELLTRNTVRITDWDNARTLIICRQDGSMQLLCDVEAC